ncbi:class I SAM-dependent methyltransferase [Limibacillus halophilus]
MEEDQEWLDWQARFHETYDEENYAPTLQSRVMNAGHAFLERSLREGPERPRILEVGTGTGAHLAFVDPGYATYLMTDLNPAVLEVAKAKAERLGAGAASTAVASALDLPYEDASFDRLIAAHVLEHLPEPHRALKEWRRVVRPGGAISILVPTDPGFAWRMGRHFGPRRQAMARGLPYDYIMAREHVNACVNLLALIRHYFPERSEHWWPFRLPSVDLNLFVAIHASLPER